MMSGGMMSGCSLLLLYIVTMASSGCHGSNPPGWIEGPDFRDIISNLAVQSLGSQYLQDEFDDHQFMEESLDGQELLEQLTNSIGSRFAKTFTAVENLKNILEEEYRGEAFKFLPQSQNNKQCCKVDDTNWVESLDFKAKVDFDSACYRFSKDATTGSTVPYSDKVFEVMKDNVGADRERALKWQYFGSADGLYVHYPAQRDPNDVCDQYDPRFQPWYVESASTLPKDIILLLDKSGSMEKWMDLATNAALTVLKALNADDRVGVISFAEDADLPPGIAGNTCYQRELAFATDENKQYLSEWIGELTPHGVSRYEEPLKKAFSLFTEAVKNVPDDPRKRIRLILFLTDGGNIDGGPTEILPILQTLITQLSHTVVLFTYGIGTEVTVKGKDLLQQIANSTAGTYTLIDSDEQLKSKLDSYYNAIQNNDEGLPVLSTPYADFSGLGLVVSVCLPVYKTTLKGVTCINISLTEALADALDLNLGKNAYAFIADYKGRTIMHPLLPDPLNYGRAVYLSIEELERDVPVQDILKSMKSGDEGHTMVRSTFIKARGTTTEDGVVAKQLEAKYFWKQIPMTNFSLCVVTTKDDKNISVNTRDLHSKHFIHHRLDLNKDGSVNLCSYSNRLSTDEYSVVKLSGAAFWNPVVYINGDDTKITVNSYQVYMDDNTPFSNDDIRSVTKQMIAIHESVEEIWTNPSPNDLFVVWRYYGDYYGSIRIYPGLPLPRAYDQTKRGWFVKAVSNPGAMTLTTPYLDAFGAGIVVTLAVPIHVGRQQGHTDSDQILGVAGMDFKIAYIEFLLKDKFAACKESDKLCFVVDSSGFLVYHDNIDYDSGEEKLVVGHHITEQEPDISTYLVSQGNLQQEPCVDFGSKQNLYTWRLHLDYNIFHYNEEPAFDLHIVTETNVYLGIRKRQTQAHRCDCPNRNAEDFKPIDRCISDVNGDKCHCPCFTAATYEYCRNTFPLKADDHVICVPQPASIGFISPIPNEEELIKELPACKDPKCGDHLSEHECNGILGCQWCPRVDGQGSCVENLVCETHTTLAPNTTVPTGHGPGLPQPAIIGIAVGVVAALVLGIVIALVIKRDKICNKRKGKKPKPGRYQPDSDMTPPIYELPDHRPDVVNQPGPRYINPALNQPIHPHNNEPFTNNPHLIHTHDTHFMNSPHLAHSFSNSRTGPSPEVRGPPPGDNQPQLDEEYLHTDNPNNVAPMFF